MAALRDLLAQFGIDVDTKKLDHANEKLDGFIEKVEKVGKQVLTAFAVKEIYEFAEGVAHQIHAVEASAAALGITTQATQQYGYAAKSAGEDSGELLNLMGRMQVAAVKGGKGFSDLKVKVKDANGHIKSADELFEDVAEGIKNTVDPAKRAAIATEIFGRSGRRLLPFLVKGKEGIKALREEFDSLGGGFDEEAIEKSKDFEHSMAKVSVVTDGIKSVFVHGVFPALTWIADKAAAIGGWFVRISKNTNLIRNALIVLGAYLTPLAFSMAAAFAPLLLATAAVAALVLIVDDLIGLFTGADSQIGEWIDKAFGKGSSAEAVRDLKEAWTGVLDVFKALKPVVTAVVDAFKWIAEHDSSLKYLAKLGRFAGRIGDTNAQVDNAIAEGDAIKSGAIKRGRGGLTFEQNSAKEQGKQLLDAEAAGKQFSPTEIPSSFKGHEDLFMGAVAQWAQQIRGERQTAVMQAMPGMMMPGGGGSGETNITVQVAGSTNMDEPALKRAVAEGVREGHQRIHRAAKHTLTQAGQKP